MNREKAKRKGIDGGWGWLVCFGSSLISLSLRSLDPSFGLLFHDLFLELDIDSMKASLIMSILDAIVNFSGLLVGPLLKKYSYRQVSFFGSLLSCSGLILTSRANSMIHIVCTYSILGGLGTGLAIAASFVALNTFFDKKRGQAVGFSMAGTTLAMMVVPQLIHLLLDAYGFRGAMLIVGGWALHSAVGACLLRPFRVESSKPLGKPVNNSSENDTLLRLNDAETTKKVEYGTNDCENNTTTYEEIKQHGKENELLRKIKETFDLDLFKDGVYLNIIVGLSLYYVAESNFKLMTPFFLSSIVMVMQSKGTSLIVIFVIIGFLRGATLVNLNLTVSEYCSLSKLPSAFGMFMVFKGLFVIMLSPLIGYIRDASKSYAICIHVMTLIISAMFVTWSIEFICKIFRKGKSDLNKKTQDVSME
ncbi:monocarboxylate transporter 2-like isoform X4 [Apis cerana]|uniref:monocarboxylate transporter 2-like isoform X4 n=1 Tax=Apis cerana TaxID=7461 RepID=UPI002B225462|nr:monocarboxylate transporter 2-like isoform X4 [Apis cerana]